MKDAIEAQGVPHTEVDLILVNGASVDFSYTLRPGDRVSVYPVFESLDIAPLLRLRPAPLREPRFVCDVHLGQLARRLRLLGFDTVYRNDYRDPEIAAIALHERRIVLTRDRLLLHRRVIERGTFVRSTDPDEQLVEVVRRFQLEHRVSPFSRCLECNGVIVPVAKEEVLDRIGEDTRRRHQEFRRCPVCLRIYWPGTHHERMMARMKRLLPDAAELRIKSRKEIRNFEEALQVIQRSPP